MKVAGFLRASVSRCTMWVVGTVAASDNSHMKPTPLQCVFSAGLKVVLCNVGVRYGSWAGCTQCDPTIVFFVVGLWVWLVVLRCWAVHFPAS